MLSLVIEHNPNRKEPDFKCELAHRLAPRASCLCFGTPAAPRAVQKYSLQKRPAKQLLWQSRLQSVVITLLENKLIVRFMPGSHAYLIGAKKYQL
jgi:hypothetical protein